MLSEQIVKRSAIGFLKHHYKFRKRRSDDFTKIQMDMIAPNGVVADGHITFLNEDGSRFLATMEATAQDTIYEVQYRLHRRKILWDSFLFSSFMTLIITLLLYWYGAFTWLIGDDLRKGLLLTLGLFGLAVGVYYIIAYKLNRYRQIFAVDQFKSYFANEQWIALAGDVFGQGEEHFLEELKRQCIFHGFGLVMIENPNEAILVISPAREAALEKQRNPLTFFTKQDVIEGNVDLSRKSWWKRIPILKRIFKSKKDRELRPGRNLIRRLSEQVKLPKWTLGNTNSKQIFQKIGSLFFLALLGGWYYFTFNISEYDYMDAAALEKLKIVPEQDLAPNDDNYIVPLEFDSSETRFFVKEKNTVQHKIDTDTSNLDEAFNRRKPVEMTPEELADLMVEMEEVNAPVEETIEEKPAKVFNSAKDCAFYPPLEEDYYIMQDNVFSNQYFADRRVAELKEAGFESGYLWLPCYIDDKPFFMVFIGEYQYERAEVLRQIEDLKAKYRGSDLDIDPTVRLVPARR